MGLSRLSATRFVIGFAVLVVAASGCTADPPPPIQSTETPESTPAVASTTGNPVVVAIDDVGTGFNPHLLADQSPANVAVSTLVLPSPFRRLGSVAGASTWGLDSALMVSAEVTSLAPFTVTYVLRDDSQWSDGAPIAAEDFRYLWLQMITQPGVVDPAGYNQIQDVQSSGGGKTVAVTMKSAYPAWRELFTDLLPSHLVKDSPGGFEQGLRDNVPVSGGQFRIKSIDKGRDEILLERNDRFWGAPATPDQILLRRGGSASQLADSMRSGDAQVAQVRGGEATEAQLSAIPNVRTGNIFQPRSLQFTINGRVPELIDTNVRRGIMGLLDQNLLAIVAAGGESSARPAGAQILSPSQPGYVSTEPAAIGRTAAVELLAAAGVFAGAPAPTPTPTTSPAPTATPTRTGDGPVLLDFVIGAPEDDDIAIAVANTAADQLREAGIEASVAPTDPSELYGTALTTGAVDAVVGWNRAVSDPATVMASRFGCPPAGAAAVASPSSSAETTDQRTPEPLLLSNVSGLCDPSLQASFELALAGVTDVGRVISEAEPKLWSLAAVLPIAQDTSVVAVGPGVSGVSLTGPPELGVFSDAAQWMRAGR
ncbi:ABC transporter family substrate-binding protein [Actinomycetes bacterium M1A6_2h]